MDTEDGPDPAPLGDEVDLRVAAALASVGGVPTAEVAASLGVEPALVHRWSRQFLDAGRRAVLNQADPDEEARRDRFLVVLSHELRTPLTVLKAAVPLLASRPDPQLVPATAALQRAVDRIEGLADLFAEAAAASLGRLPTTPTVFDLGALVDDLAVQAGFHVERDADARVACHADRDHVTTIVRDLLVAAQGGRTAAAVATSVGIRDGWCEVAVERRPVLPVDHVHALLDPFAVVDDASEVTLGLYRARALAVANGGQLGARGDDDHTSLWLRVPDVRAARPTNPSTRTIDTGATPERTLP